VLFTAESIKSGQADPSRLKLLLESQAEDEMMVDIATYDDLSYILTQQSQEITVHTTDMPLASYDVVYLRRIVEATAQAIAVGTFCKARGIAVFDTEIATRPGSMGKLNQYLKLSLAGLPFPETVYSSSHERLIQAFDAHTFEYPVILKSVSGRRGSNNHLIRTRQELESSLAAQPSVHYLIQAYVPNTGDYRVWVTGGEIGPILHRARMSGHLNNTSQGSGARLVEVSELPDSVRADCIRATQIFDRDVAGVDVVFENDDTEGRYYFFEVNRAPQIENTPFEEVKAAALAQYMSRITKGSDK
jgi:glutathione synthase/RimK-type ligase-like ATP-grasp enzyme